MGSNERTWRTDWSMFVDLLGEELRRSTTLESISAVFGNQEVVWSGVLEEKSLKFPGPTVAIAMPEAQLDLGNAVTIILDDICLPVASEAVSDWQSIPIGTSLSFVALLEGGPYFPPVEVKRLRSGGTVVMIRLTQGRPLTR